MIAALLKALLPLAPTLLPIVLGWFGVKVPPPGETDLQAGERLGKVETNAQNSNKELQDVRKAVEAADAAGNHDDTGGLREPHPGDKPWNPDGIG